MATEFTFWRSIQKSPWPICQLSGQLKTNLSAKITREHIL